MSKIGRPHCKENPLCIYCGGYTRKMGYSRKHHLRRYWCFDCKRSFTEGQTIIHLKGDDELKEYIKKFHERSGDVDDN